MSLTGPNSTSLTGPRSFSHYKSRGFGRFFAQLSCCVFFVSDYLPISKNRLFQKKGAFIVFFKFLCFKFEIWNFSFLGLLKHYKNGGFSQLLWFLLLKKRKRQQQKTITGISGFGFFGSKKWPFRDAYLFSKKNLFYSVFWVRVFWAKLSKRGNLGHPPKEKFDW